MNALLEEPFATIPGDLGGESQARSAMKLMTCVIRPESLDAVKDALSSLGVVGGMTVTEVRGFGRQRGHVEHYRGEAYVIRFLPKLRVDIAVQTEEVDRVMTAVGHAARTGQVGDGKIFVLDMRAAMRIRTGERGTGAL